MFRLLIVIALMAGQVLAEPASNPDAGLAVAPEVLKEFRVIEELSAKADYVAAARKAELLLPSLATQPAGRALLLHNLATLYALQKHYLHSAGILQDCLALHALPPAEAGRAQFELGQYYAMAEDYPKAVAALSDWLSGTQSPTVEQLLLAADVHLRLKQHDHAMPLIERAIATSPQPRTEWYQLLLGLYYEKRDYANSARILSTLVERLPDNVQYWNQLTGIYQQAGKNQQALATQQLMYRRGLLKSSGQIMQLVQVMRSRGLKSRAAELLQREIERGNIEKSAPNLELLASIWVEAKELRKAAGSLETAIALNHSCEAQHRLGQIYSELHDWAKAHQALSHAVNAGGLKNPGGAYLLLGLADYRLKNKDQARDAFLKAQQSPSVRQNAKQWLEHIDRELGRS